MSKGPVSVRYAFGDCILDSDTRQVCRAGQPVHLGPKAWDLLQVLIEARPRVLSKLQLLASVWPETMVSESSLSTIVAELRDARGDTAREARYVRTVYGFGYAFAARVTPLPAVRESLAPSPVCCRLIWGENRIEVREGEHLIGRAPDALVTIDDPLVSRHHARITLAGGVLTLEDLDSRNGTSRNGQPVSAAALLINGDVIGVGPVQLQVSLGAEYGVSTLSASASCLDAAAHDPAAVDDNRLSRHVAARR